MTFFECLEDVEQIINCYNTLERLKMRANEKIFRAF